LPNRRNTSLASSARLASYAAAKALSLPLLFKGDDFPKINLLAAA
jgi:uncharacterized protein with PIN domain